MASIKGRILNTLGSLLLTDGTITEITDLSPHFRLFRASVPAEAGWMPGDKAQLVLPSRDVRTYTPIDWDGGLTSFLVFLHADTPAVRWARAAAVGDPVRFKGPDRSLSMPDGPITLIGDETSIAVMAAYQRARDTPVRALLAASVDVKPVLDAIGLTAQVFGPGQHDTIVDAAGDEPIGITGSGALIKGARGALRARGAKAARIKAYWVAGRAGLD